MPWFKNNHNLNSNFKRWASSVLFGVLNLAALVMFVWILKTGFEPLAGHAATGIYKALNFRGTLKNSDNTSVTDGTYSMKFTIYDASSGGNCLYTARGSCGTPTAKSLAVTSGVFSTLIGDTDNSDNAITIDFNSDTYWLGVTVGTDAELTPRVRIGASGYAFNADLLDGLNTSSNGGTTSYVPITNNYGNLMLTGEPRASDVSSSTLYVNPATATSTFGLLGAAVGGVEKFRVDASGNVAASGTIYAAGVGTSTFSGGLSAVVLNITSTSATSTFANGIALNGGCFSDISGNCISASGSNAWTDGGTEIYLTTSGDNVTVGASGNLGKLTVLGDADEKQFVIKANATQNANIFEIQNSSSAPIAWLNNSGNFGVSGTIYGSIATSTWYGSIATTTFYGSLATSTWYGNIATSTFYGSLATSTWYGSLATSTWYGNIATSTFPNITVTNLATMNRSSSTLASAYQGLFVGTTATTSIYGQTTSTFGAGIAPATGNSYDLGGYGSAWRNIFSSGTIYGNGLTTGGSVTIGGGAAGYLTVNTEAEFNQLVVIGNGTEVSINSNDWDIDIQGYVSGIRDIDPVSNNNYDLGSYGTAWRNVYVSGTIYGSLSTSTLDNVIIGGSTPTSAYFTRASSTFLSVFNTIWLGGTVTSTFTTGNRGLATSSFYSDLSVVNRDFVLGGAANTGNLWIGNGTVTSTLLAGNRGSATSTLYSDLSIVNRDLVMGGGANTGWLWVGDGTATTTIRGGTAGSATSTFEGDVVVSNLYSGLIEFTEDGGIVPAANISINTAATGTTEGYTFDVDGLSTLFVGGTSDGLASVWDRRVGILTTTPSSTLEVLGTFSVGNGSSTTTIYANTTSTFGAGIAPGANNSYDLGGYGSAWRNIFSSGTIYGSLATSTFYGSLATSTWYGSLATSTFYGSLATSTWYGSFSTSTLDGVTIGGSTAATGTFSGLAVNELANLKGNVTLGDSTNDTIIINGYVNSSIVPVLNASKNLGNTNSGYRWLNIYGETITAYTNIYDPNIGNLSTAQDAVCWESDGRFTKANGSSGCVSSSRRFKHNIETLTSGLDVVNQLRPVSFAYNQNNEENVGFIAEEVNGVDTKLVVYDEDGTTPKSVKYLNITAYLAKAIQELSAEIDSMKASSTLSVVNDPSGIGPILAKGGIDMASSSIINVASISGAKWVIDEQGNFTTSGEIIKKVATSAGEKDLYPAYTGDPAMMLTGSGQLMNGEARIIFDPALTEILDSADPIKVTVSMTSEGSQNIYVAEKSIGDILVRETNGGKGGASFDYIIVARRKVDGAYSSPLAYQASSTISGGIPASAGMTEGGGGSQQFPNSLLPQEITTSSPSSSSPYEGGGTAGNIIADNAASSTMPVATNSSTSTESVVQTSTSTEPIATESATSAEPVATEAASFTPVAAESGAAG